MRLPSSLVAPGLALLTACAEGGSAILGPEPAPAAATAGSGGPSLSLGAGPTVQELVVRVLDVGVGDATMITNGNSRVIIDGGRDRKRFRALLDSLGVKNATVDAVIISHGHSDHFWGLMELFTRSRNVTIGYVFENQDPTTDTKLKSLRDSINARAGRGELVYRDSDDPCGDGSPVCTLELDGGALLHVMRPMPNGKNPDERSTPVKLVGPDSASFTMWLAGDATQTAIRWFDSGADYDAFPGMKVDVLKGDHHGGCDGVTTRYLELLAPQWATFSLRASNTSGYVNTQTKALFTQVGIPWYRTDQNGTITFVSPGTPEGGFSVTPSRGSPNQDGPSDAKSTQKACNPIP